MASSSSRKRSKSKNNKKNKKTSEVEEESARALLELKGFGNDDGNADVESNITLLSSELNNNGPSIDLTPKILKGKQGQRSRSKKQPNDRDDSKLQGIASKTNNDFVDSSLSNLEVIHQIKPYAHSTNLLPSSGFACTDVYGHQVDGFQSQSSTTFMDVFQQGMEVDNNIVNQDFSNYTSLPSHMPSEISSTTKQKKSKTEKKEKKEKKKEMKEKKKKEKKEKKKEKKREKKNKKSKSDDADPDVRTLDNSMVDPMLVDGMNVLKEFIEGAWEHGEVDNEQSLPLRQVDRKKHVPEKTAKKSATKMTKKEQQSIGAAAKPISVELDDHTPTPVTIKNKPRPRNQILGEPPPEMGGFTAEEIALIDAYFAAYRNEHTPPLSYEELCKRVWQNSRAKDQFWGNVFNVLPHRKPASIYKHVRRTYHVFENRGKWTNDEDLQLKVLVEEKGTKWKEIGEVIGRMPEDCRDRHRNYIKCGEKRGQNTWSEKEENMLREAISTCVERLLESEKVMQHVPGETEQQRQDRIENATEGAIDKLIWTQVSDAMNGYRSRIQCRYKWKKWLIAITLAGGKRCDLLKPNNGIIASSAVTTTKRKRGKEEAEPVTEEGEKSKPKRVKRGNGTSRKPKGNEMRPGDECWLLSEIENGNYQKDSYIPWDKIAQSDPFNEWSEKTLRTTYTRLKAKVPNHNRLDVPTIIKAILADLETLPAEELNMRSKSKMPEQTKPPKQSAEFITASDDEAAESMPIPNVKQIKQKLREKGNTKKTNTTALVGTTTLPTNHRNILDEGPHRLQNTASQVMDLFSESDGLDISLIDGN